MRAPRLGALLAPVLPLVISLGCSSSTTTTPPVDSGVTDVPPGDVPPGDVPVGDVPVDTEDASSVCDGELPPVISMRPSVFFLNPGATGTVTVLLAHDRCAPVTLPVSLDGTGVTATVPSVMVPAGGSTATVDLHAVSPGTSTLHVGTGTLTVIVLPPGVPGCPAATPSVMGHLAPGGTVAGTAGTPLAKASISLPMAAASNPPVVPPLDVTLGCAVDQVPAGFTAVGPAVTIGPVATHLQREVPITLPVNGGMVPVGYELQIEVSYTGAVTDARHPAQVVPVADLHLSDDGLSVVFSAPWLGTYQAVIRQGLGGRHYTRHFTWHAILGVSMGAAGASMIGARHMDKFDFIAPLGGPVDWNYLGHYIETYHLGGFCTAAQRLTDPTCAMGAMVSRTPPNTELLEHPQDFEHWYYPDGSGGQGGTFDRQSYTQIFRDLTRMFGNAVMAPGPTGVLPAGVPDTEITRSDADRCATPVVIPTGYYDDEYNPDGTLPVVTFCDGTHIPGHVGVWDGTVGNFPLEVGLAVDVNHNGRRDYGEPVIRDFHEPWRDYGTDGIPSAMEPGYNPVTNPDPAGDDYNRQYNPAGTEGNFAYEMGEPFDDIGVDGVRCPHPGMCPYDLGEGNGRFDLTPGAQRFRDVNPRTLLAGMSDDVLHRVELWTDGGVRDLFNFGCDADHLIGALAQRNRPVHYYNNFAPLAGNRVPEDPFPYSYLDWALVPGNVMVRYGHVDATPAQLIDGDGGHVGTINQITNRLFSSLWWIQARWPQGDRTVQPFSSDTDNAGHCANGYFCTFNFHSDQANRTGPVSIYLPPGYHDPANAGVTYPVVFFLHGYGQQPMDLSASGLVIGNFMASASIATWQRPQKYIMVFPDGRCRDGDGCLRGTFYTDSPVHNVQMETYFLDLYSFIDTTYRVRPPADIDVTE